MSGLRICLIASSRFPIREPFAGGLESHTHALAHELTARGHEVTLFAAPGSDPRLGTRQLPVQAFPPGFVGRPDISVTPENWMAEHHAYLGLMLELAASGRQRFDVVHNNSLHHLPVAMASTLAVPMVTTLHTPPVPWLESALHYASANSAFVSVSRFTALAWAHAVTSTTILNGVDVDRWQQGAGGGPAIWSGRIVPEKGPHLAIDAARLAGMPLVLAGPSLDRAYFDAEIAPRLGGDVTYLGHLDHDHLRREVAAARVAVVTPTWDEPYGLVAAEALACGTPVAAFARGALPEIVDETVGALAVPDDVADLARAMEHAAGLDRSHVRRVAVERCSISVMVDRYEQLYDQLAPRAAA
ncbi:glycosyltransferase [Aeromicrobium sp. 636]|uniref:Glycosyltransferase family 4 protein n=1 Tax=Aeromicrobium senzhongii TaxID=2663859 RepID=A0A8I0EWE4_9ACTN|nr:MULTISPECIES: glycosyltransferase family 4 protein [Aeromicrobium]MBC9226557.1 glycosyltransferase family 4 protein [Aeromicrobium senzhongii]MCQ3998659.1 glycosyltransferase [Aeromicrobium sp. 636]